jgi:Catechol dioxygenase N terminus
MSEERTRAVRGAAARQTTPAQITEAVIASFAGCAQPRLRAIMTRLIGHLHAFVREAEITEAEWHEAIRILTRTGEVTDANRQEFILWSDTRGSHFEPRSAEEPERPEGISGPWFSVHHDIALAPGDEPEATVDPGGTA